MPVYDGASKSFVALVDLRQKINEKGITILKEKQEPRLENVIKASFSKINKY